MRVEINGQVVKLEANGDVTGPEPARGLAEVLKERVPAEYMAGLAPTERAAHWIADFTGGVVLDKPPPHTPAPGTVY